ncbi:MAG: long-chain fatty acid--CoA ligase [Maritimibacter sp.]
MQGMMMNRPLSIISILDYAATAHRESGIVSVETNGTITRHTYPEIYKRVGQLAHALKGLGIEHGDRVATLAWNNVRHFELYYGISGIGAICHTINPRLSAEQMVYIINHAEDKVIFVDTTFLPIIAALREHLPADLQVVVMTDAEHMPETPLEVLCYDDLTEGQPESYDWPELDENTAAGLCYTSGTTGNPKGALYSHRSNVLHALMVSSTIGMALPESENGINVLPVVPLFHVNAWGLPYFGPMLGINLIMPGPGLDGASLYKLMDAEDVGSAWGVPTIWAALLQEIEKNGRVPKGLRDVAIGGSAAPRSMIEAFENLGVNVNHAWGMTETSPVGTHGGLPSRIRKQPLEQQLDYKQKQGRRVFGVDLKIADLDGNHLPHDGKAVGELFVRGNSVVSGYFKNEEASKAAIDAEGWFATGDVASIDAEGFLLIQDRTKDLIKSGGEWISSIDLENAAVSHPGIAMCAAVGVAHPKWDERPILIAVAANGEEPSLDELHSFLSGQFAKWQLPDDVIWVENLPMTATGKVSKLTLRNQLLSDYKHPDVA